MISVMKVQNIIIGGDADAHSLWWGCMARTEDTRRVDLAESLPELGLEILNQGAVSIVLIGGGKLAGVSWI